MKVPLVYPKIPSPENCPLKTCIAFEKYDGTNIHWKWDVDFGWVSFGTRRDTYDLDDTSFTIYHPGLEQVIQAFDPIKDKLAKCLSNKRIKEAIVFTEFFGQHSFAGSHNAGDEKSLIIIDAMFDGMMLEPNLFLGELPKLPLARVVYRGKYNGNLIDDVRNGKYKVNEGVVCKGLVKDQLYMTKIKTNAYMRRLKNNFDKNWKEYWE
jgi:hypothetical protein